METVEDVVDELLGLVEASSKNPVEEFLHDLVQVSSKDVVEKSVENSLDTSSGNDKIDEIMNDLINGTCKDEMEELLDDMAEISVNDTEDEKNCTNMSTKDKMNQQLETLMEASSRDGMNQQLLKDLVHVAVNELIEEILREMSKVSSFKDSTETSLKNSPKAFPTNLLKEESSESLTQESPMHPSVLIPDSSDSTVSFHFTLHNFYVRDVAQVHAVRYEQILIQTDLLCVLFAVFSVSFSYNFLFFLSRTKPFY